MSDLAWPTTASGAAVAIFFFAFFHRDIRAWTARRGNHPSLPETQSPPQPKQLESVLASEQHQRDHETQIIKRHAQTDAENQRIMSALTQAQAKDQKTIARLTASNAKKDAEITRLKAQIPAPLPPLTAEDFFKPRPPKKTKTGSPLDDLLS